MTDWLKKLVFKWPKLTRNTVEEIVNWGGTLNKDLKFAHLQLWIGPIRQYFRQVTVESGENWPIPGRNPNVWDKIIDLMIRKCIKQPCQWYYFLKNTRFGFSIFGSCVSSILFHVAVNKSENCRHPHLDHRRGTSSRPFIKLNEGQGRINELLLHRRHPIRIFNWKPSLFAPLLPPFINTPFEISAIKSLHSCGDFSLQPPNPLPCGGITSISFLCRVNSP